LLYVLSLIGLFTIGGLTGLFLAALAVDVHVTDTYFVVAHFHYIMVGGMVTAFMGGLHYWWPKMTGRMYPELAGKLAALTTFLGFNLTFFPQFLLGYLGMPRRYHAYPPEFQVFHVLSTAGASILGIGYLLPLIYFLWALKHGRAAGPNPWRATGLEWQTPSPPPTTNFEETPVVTGLLGLVFMSIKAVEYHTDYVDHLIPGTRFYWAGADPRNAELFFWLYFGMTGLHAIHVTVGIGVLLVLALLAWHGRFAAGN